MTSTAEHEVHDLVTAVLDGEAARQAEQAGRGQADIDVHVTLPGVGTAAIPLRDVVRAGGTSTIGILTTLVLVDALEASAFSVFGPDIQATLNLSDLALGFTGALGGLVVVLATLPLGTLADRTRRTRIVGVCSVVWVAIAAMTGAVQALWQLVLVRMGAGMAKANEGPVHQALLADAYPVEGRNRIFGIHRAAQPVGMVIGPAFAAVLAALLGDGAWRWAFPLIALCAVLPGLAALRLPEPRRGRNEMLSILGAEIGELAASETQQISLDAGFARLKKIRTFYAVLCALGVLGLAFVSAPIYLSLFLRDHYELGASGRGLVLTAMNVGSLVGVVIGATVGDRVFQRSPEQSLRLTGGLVASFGVLLPVALLMPNPALFAIVGALASGTVFCAFVPMSAVIAAVTPYRLRSTGFATVGLYMSLFGGIGGALLVGQLSAAYGERTALIVVVAPAAALGGLLLRRGARHVRADMLLASAEIVEERDELTRVAAGGDAAVLQVRNLDFSYGPVQVLFGIDLDVWEGEVLALLGTNGAGKSTLLRAISGLGVADRGVVRFEGRTLTYADPASRVRSGIVQVSGGKAVFPSVSVADNLAAAAYSLGNDRAAVAEAIDRVTSLFPILAERMEQPAGTLSGGEQQMLGLAMALMLRPKLLLIDELSLGLAPVVVQAMLEVVEQLKADGITMVIVEQSVNVALSIADRAVFMEKGQIRFEGAAAELLERDDLVRAVFLGNEGG